MDIQEIIRAAEKPSRTWPRPVIEMIVWTRPLSGRPIPQWLTTDEALYRDGDGNYRLESFYHRRAIHVGDDLAHFDNQIYAIDDRMIDQHVFTAKMGRKNRMHEVEEVFIQLHDIGMRGIFLLKHGVERMDYAFQSEGDAVLAMSLLEEYGYLA